jgi:uncharacterized protein
MIENNSFLGVGWAFPPSFDPYGKGVELVHGEQDVHQSLQILLSTMPGEHIMELQYGCDLSPLAFQRLDLNLKTFMANNIKQAILYYEPRIRINEITLEQGQDTDGMIHVHIKYTIKATNVRENLVYIHPFF